MKHIKLLCLILLSFKTYSQTNSSEKYYVGVSFGTSFALGDFKDTDINNQDAGFSKDGKKYDIYGGYFLNDRITLAAGIRIQNFETEISDVINSFNELNPGLSFSGQSGDWKTYYLLVGASYKIPIVNKFAIYPRIGLGPLIVQSPTLIAEASNLGSSSNFSRSSGNGLGLGYELGIGLKTNLGKRFALISTFLLVEV
jgi:hypothetical protein